ncbi:hypothetical protein EO087_10335 [Dyella sp. M7H15-1]|uniref:hypothetical protein n=1 Tax=Dyella sp. M7H15-1 TaxID=2501295 RepID=UPI0010051F81|nr:hypothetical protein [Dyella sp. M7H15-1]QAU24338.1 hypothetical protein EO087_10335 [Dyella sp. M7H15-1]
MKKRNIKLIDKASDLAQKMVGNEGQDKTKQHSLTYATGLYKQAVTDCYEQLDNRSYLERVGKLSAGLKRVNNALNELSQNIVNLHDPNLDSDKAALALKDIATSAANLIALTVLHELNSTNSYKPVYMHPNYLSGDYSDSVAQANEAPQSSELYKDELTDLTRSLNEVTRKIEGLERGEYLPVGHPTGNERPKVLPFHEDL